jgi:hypothetical protein
MYGQFQAPAAEHIFNIVWGSAGQHPTTVKKTCHRQQVAGSRYQATAFRNQQPSARNNMQNQQRQQEQHVTCRYKHQQKQQQPRPTAASQS